MINKKHQSWLKVRQKFYYSKRDQLLNNKTFAVLLDDFDV